MPEQWDKVLPRYVRLPGILYILYDIQADLTKTALSMIRKNLDTSVEKNKISAQQKDEALRQDSGCW